ncbi:MAG: energy-coupling factor transporter ATPase [Oscillospiraceae bacterium]|nr:energy-coupling factor transporter ATPase [Oscillospiraceae bacterium]
MDTVISIENVSYHYPDAAENVLKNVSLAIPAGSFTAILGHNGSGKSTLAKLCNAILIPTEGRVTVNGLDTSLEDNLIPVRRTVGMVFQNPDNQIVASVVEDDVAFAPENLGVESAEIRRRVDDALRRVGMYEFRLHAPHLLSGGQKQRIAIAGVLAMQPKILVLDEPTAMLDPLGRKEVLSTVEELRAETGMTVLLITHHMDECIGADRVIVVSDGQLVMDGAPGEVFSRVEELRALGLDVPDTTETLYELRKAGLDLPLDALTIDACADVLAGLFTKSAE